MHAARDQLEFAPPPTPGLLRSMVLAMLAHGVLLLALTWGVHWKRDVELTSAQAELWSSIPQEAAPAPREPEPEPPPPAPAPEPRQPPPQPAPEPPQVEQPKVDIALEREKQRLKKERELEKKEALQKEALKLEKRQQDKLQVEKLKQDKLKQEQADKAKQAALDKKDAVLEAKQLEAQRTKNLQRMAGLAGATGSANATGTALKSSGPSASYAGRIVARIRPNIVFTGTVVGDPTTEVEVKLAPNGTIVGRKIVKTSGQPAWDEAVLRAIDKTETLPRDTDGRVPTQLILVFNPNS